MIAPDFPCKTCRHAAEQHFANISTDDNVCIGCQDYNRNNYDGNEQFHKFIGDNLAYMELQKKKKDILSEQA